ELKRIHSKGVCHNDIKYGNILLEQVTGEPFFLDFELSSVCGTRRWWWWEAKRDYEIDQFNLHFGTNHATLRLLEERLPSLSRGNRRYPFQSVRFRRGLVLGNPGDAWAGEVIWDELRGFIFPLLNGAKVLGLNCGNAFLLTQMLRHGASGAVGIEEDPEAVIHGEFVRKGFEWSDSATYRLKIGRETLSGLDLEAYGEFDAVFLFKGLPGSTEREKERFAAAAGRISDHVFLWCDPSQPPCIPHGAGTAQAALEKGGFQIDRRLVLSRQAGVLLHATRK
ncbi:MAG: DUF1698 domain-containing protein, partial [Thermodesulfobacteriota bacterium]